MKIIAKIPAWMLLCLFALSPITETMYSSSLPQLSHFFGITGNTAQITSSLYYLGFALGILSLGRLSDIFGRRPLIIIGLALYIISTAVSIFAINIEMLVIARFCQAFGASVGSVIGQAMARDSYQGSELSYVYSSLSIWLALVPSIGSSAGSYIVEYLNWQYIFVFLTVFASLLFYIFLQILPETNPYINIVQDSRYFSVLQTVIRDKAVLLYAVIIGSFNGMTYGFFIEAPFIFIDGMKIAPSSYGKLSLLLCISNVSGGLLSSYLVKQLHVNNVKIMVAGLICSLIGCLMLVLSSYLIAAYTINITLSILIIFIPIMLHMVGHYLLVPFALRYALENYAKTTGAAGSIFGSLYYIITALIIFVVSKLHSNSISNFALFFLLLAICCSFSLYFIRKSS